MIHFLVTAAQEHAMRDYLDSHGAVLADRLRILHYEALPDLERLERGTYVLSALEYVGPAMRAFLRAVHARLAGAEGFRFLNDPTRTLGRYELLRELSGRGINPFRAVRAADGDLSGLRYPVFLRGERSHDGTASPLLGSAREVEAAIGRVLVAGRRLDDLLVVEFCDTSDDRGYFRKYCAFLVGDRVVPRRLDYGPPWMLKHDGSEFSVPMAEEEMEYVLGNPHADRLAEIRDLAGVGYGTIDYAVKDGRIVVWEINLSPRICPGPGDTYVPKPAEVETVRRPTLEGFHAGFRMALEAMDQPGGGPPVALDLDPRIAAAARERATGLPAGGGTLARMLRPVRPIVEPLATSVLPLVGRWARHRAAARRGAP